MKKLTTVMAAILLILGSCKKEEIPENIAPKSDNQEFTIAEDVQGGEVLGTIVATDSEGDDLVFTIETNDNDLFAITPTGVLSLAEGKSLNYDVAQSHTITVQISDNTDTTQITVTITVTNVLDVYVAGLIRNEVNVQVMALWKNGELTQLTDGTYNAVATGVFVDGDDVYVIGRQSGTTQQSKAVVYLNGTLHQELTDGTAIASLNDIKVVNGTVYIAGYEAAANGNFVAKVWVDGTPTSLSDNVSSVASASSVFVLDDVVYIGGQENAGVTTKPMLWKLIARQAEITSEALSKGNDGGESGVSSMYVSGADVYAAGSEHNGTHRVATLWKNGIPTNPVGDQNSSQLTKIFIANGSVYTVSLESVPGVGVVGRLIKDDDTPITLNSGQTDLFARGLFVFGDDVYVAGSEREKGTTKDLPVLFKNGERTILYESDFSAATFSVFVK